MKDENILIIAGVGLFALYLFSKNAKTQAIATAKTTPVVTNPGLVQTPGLLSQTATSQLISETPSILNSLQNLFGNNSQTAQAPAVSSQNNNATSALTASSDASYDETSIVTPSSLSDFQLPSQDFSSTITGIDETEYF